ncbi:SAG family member [Eimeria necatrix]|uniref:SAG family member n=1 Tax=Eimeria necatrix TaxID=51315 RepID=U6MH09_9EIME|nr:SAG family member [Eimeria necatrix]CDJ62353.1 SAG family member [Eimeria necatrix]
MLHWSLPPLLSSLLMVLTASNLGGSQTSAPTIKYTATLDENAVCLSEVNAAREAAGLANFKEAPQENKLTDPQTELEEEWKKVCTHLIPTEETGGATKSSSTNPFKDGTYAFKPLDDAEPNCKETVDYWKAAFKNFTGLPPSKTEGTDLYKKQDNVSFVALYNPSSNATADCRVVTCTQTTTSGSLPATATSGGEGGTTKNGYALICKTMPTAFANDTSAPFTQEQWDRIKSSLTGSASIAAPSLAALFIVALGITSI